MVGSFFGYLQSSPPLGNKVMTEEKWESVGQNLLGGTYILLGTFAYRSCKRRMLGLRESTWARKILEVVGPLVIILHALWVFSPQRMIENPFVPVIILPWILVAYLVIVVRSWVQKRKNQNHRE